MKLLLCLTLLLLITSCSYYSHRNYSYYGLEKVDSKNEYICIELESYLEEGFLGKVKEAYDAYDLIVFSEDAKIISRIPISNITSGSSHTLHSCSDSLALLSSSQSIDNYRNEYFYLLNIYTGNVKDLNQIYDTSKVYHLTSESDIIVTTKDSILIKDHDFDIIRKYRSLSCAEPGFYTKKILLLDSSFRLNVIDSNGIKNEILLSEKFKDSLAHLGRPTSFQWLTENSLSVSFNKNTYIGNISNNSYLPQIYSAKNAFPLSTKKGIIYNDNYSIIYSDSTNSTNFIQGK